MRIVGGRWRGRAIRAPEGRGTRPTQDRVREAMASMVASALDLDLSDATVLDPFAGSGALSLELLSRGARHATLVERDTRALAAIRANVEAFGAQREVDIVRGDALSPTALDRLRPTYSVVLLDPPYALDPRLLTDLIASLSERGLLDPDPVVLHERSRDAAPIDPEAMAALGLARTSTRPFGSTVLDLWKHPSQTRSVTGGQPPPSRQVGRPSSTRRVTGGQFPLSHRDLRCDSGDCPPVTLPRKELPMQPNGITHVVVPGSFDPVTLGHIDVIARARRLSPQVTVAVAASDGKRGVGTSFSLEERIELVRASLADAGLDDVAVVGLRGLLVDLCHELGAHAVVKGLRAATDFEYELQQAAVNQSMAPDIESVFIMSRPDFSYVSSSVVREIAALGGDVSALVPACVAARLAERAPSGR